MRIAIAIIFMTLTSLLGTVGQSDAQTVRDDDSGGEGYFLKAVQTLCGPRAQVRLSSRSASIYLSGEYLQDRNLDATARNIAIDGLNAFTDSPSFYVYIQDSRGSGSAEVHR